MVAALATESTLHGTHDSWLLPGRTGESRFRRKISVEVWLWVRLWDRLWLRLCGRFLKLAQIDN